MQQPLDHTKDSLTQHKKQPKIFPFKLKTKHKTLHNKQARAELEILQKKTIYTTFDQ